MRKIDYKILIITCLVCLAPMILGIVLYNQLPEQMAIHFDINNNPNGFASKNLAVFGLPVLMAILQIIVCIPTDLSEQKNKKMLTIMKWFIPILTVILYVLTIFYGIGKTVDMKLGVNLIMGFVFIVLGNYLPKAEPNLAIGVRIKSTLTNKEVWNKVNRIEAFSLVIFGFLFIITAFLPAIFPISVLIIFLIQTVAILIYARVLNKKMGGNEND